MQDFEARVEEREALLAQLEVQGYLTDPRLEEAMLAVPRHLFVPEDRRDEAYMDRPIPLPFGQTVSAPHMVAMMSSALQLEQGDNVLEIGAGAGYHAAVVQEMVRPGLVTSLEYLPELAELARANLRAAKSEVNVVTGDGAHGYEEGGPYDAILVTCAIPHIPEPLVDQLREGGHFIAPIGMTQCTLWAGRKQDGMLKLDDLGPCLFVNAQGDFILDE